MLCDAAMQNETRKLKDTGTVQNGLITNINKYCDAFAVPQYSRSCVTDEFANFEPHAWNSYVAAMHLIDPILDPTYTTCRLFCLR